MYPGSGMKMCFLFDKQRGKVFYSDFVILVRINILSSCLRINNGVILRANKTSCHHECIICVSSCVRVNNGVILRAKHAGSLSIAN
jgi:hypothetical protein